MQSRAERLRAVHGGKHYPDKLNEERGRDYLTRDEVASLLRAAKKSRHGARDHAMIMLAYRHGLRASELVGLRLSDLDLNAGTIYCRRAKGGRRSVHPMKEDEVAAVERVLRQRKWQSSEYVFESERSEKMTRSAFWRVVSQTGERAGCHSRHTRISCDTPVATTWRTRAAICA